MEGHGLCRKRERKAQPARPKRNANQMSLLHVSPEGFQSTRNNLADSFHTHSSRRHRITQQENLVATAMASHQNGQHTVKAMAKHLPLAPAVLDLKVASLGVVSNHQYCMVDCNVLGGGRTTLPLFLGVDAAIVVEEVALGVDGNHQGAISVDGLQPPESRFGSSSFFALVFGSREGKWGLQGMSWARADAQVPATLQPCQLPN